MTQILPRNIGMSKMSELPSRWATFVRWSRMVLLRPTWSETFNPAGGSSITAATEATAIELTEAAPVACDGGNSSYLIDFTCPRAVGPAAANTLRFVVFEDDGSGAVPIGQIAIVGSGVDAPVSGRLIRNPFSFGLSNVLTWSVRAYVTGGTGTIYGEFISLAAAPGSTGGAGKAAPILMTVTAQT